MMTNAHSSTAVPVSITFGGEDLTLDIPADRLVRLDRADAAAPVDAVQAVREALESPHHYPPLRQALTPDDHVTVVVDEHLPRVAELVTAVLEHVVAAGVDPAAITLLCPPTTSKQPWIEDLPDAFQEVHTEVHDPADRNRLAYLASTKRGQRIYLNRSAVDADQLVVLTGPHFDPLHGYAGAEGALYPALSDAEARQRWHATVRSDVPAHDTWPVRKEAGEVCWLLGAPFFVQVLEGAGDDVVQVLGGIAESFAAGRESLDRSWRATAAEPADLVIATVGGDPARHTVADLARGLATASRVVKTDGVIALLTAASPELGDGFQRMLKADEPEEALAALKVVPPADWPAAFEWLDAVRNAHVYLLSGWPAETAEGLFTTPMANARQVQRLIDAGGNVLVLPDAHKMMVTTP